MALDLEASLVQITAINTVIAMAIHTIMAMVMVMVVTQMVTSMFLIAQKKPPYLGGFFYTIFLGKFCELKLSNSLPLYPLFF